MTKSKTNNAANPGSTASSSKKSKGAAAKNAAVEKRVAAELDADILSQTLFGTLASLPDAIGIWNSDDQLIAYNAGFETMFASFPDIRLGKTIGQFFLDFAKTGAIEAIKGKEEKWVEERLAERREGIGKEFVYQTHDGKWISRIDKPMPCGGLISIRKDVTEEKNREEQVNSQGAELELAFAAMGDLTSAVLVRDQDLKYRIANHAFADMYGKSMDEIIGKDAVELFGAEAASKFDPGNLEVIKTGKPYQVEEVLTFPDGREMVCLTDVKQVISKSGEKFACITITDVSELREREKILAEKSNKLTLTSASLQNLNSAVLVKDKNLKYVLVNNAFCEILGKSEEELIGKTTLQVFGSERAEEYDNRESKVLETGAPLEFEETFLHGDGSYRSAMTSITRIVSDDGESYACVSVSDVTELKKREDELKQLAGEIELHRQKMENFAETSADWFWETDEELRYTFFSDGLVETIGFEPADLIGKTREDLWKDKELTDEQRAHLSKLENRERIKDYVYSISNPAGQEYWISVSGSPGFDSDGNFVGYYGSGRDVTEQIARETALKEARLSAEKARTENELFKVLLDSAPTAIYAKDSDLKLLYGNPVWEKMAKTDLASAIGKTDEEIFGSQGQRLMADDLKVLQAGVSIEAAEVGTNEDGSEQHRNAYKARFTDDNGLHYVLGVTVDVTNDVEQKHELEKAHSDLAQNQKRIESFANASADWFWEMDADLKFSYFSETYQQIAKVDPKKLLGKTRRETGLSGMSEEEFEQFMALMERHEPYQDMVNSRTMADGTLVWHSTSGVPIFEDDGTFAGYRGTGKDVTLQVERQQRLELAEAEALKADRAKSEFLANMSHEIRTPMNGVMGMAELLAKTELDAKQKMFTDVIVKSGASLLTIINDILDFSKLDAGQMELDCAPFRLAEAIEDVATLVSSRVSEKDLELIVRIDPDLPEHMVGDVGRIRQIVTNLMGNAVKFTESGHVFVNVNSVLDVGIRENHLRLRFEVEDTGIGIPQEQVAAVFEKFSQVDTSSSRKHEGTGLGLTIASSLVEIMDGKIGVESEVGKGSTFWFEIELPIHGEVGSRKRVPMDVTGARILIVDDNAVNRSILSEQMTAWQFDSAAAVDGEEGLAVMRAAKENGINIDCVVLDYHMPGMNGGEVVKTMRSDPLLKDISVIMLTSVDQTEDGKVFSSLGIQRHLTKPARSSHLLETIISVLEENNFTPIKQKVETTSPVMVQSSNSPAEEPKTELAAISETPLEDRVEILVCEDNEVNQIVFTQILESAGYDFRIAPNGKVGVEMVKSLRPELILMDVSMPEMNGLQATAAIREMEKETKAHTPIIGVTAHAIKGDMEKCIAAGMDDYLSKPVSPDALQQKIDQWFKTVRKLRKA